MLFFEKCLLTETTILIKGPPLKMDYLKIIHNFFPTNSNKGKLYIKIVALGMINNFVILKFFICNLLESQNVVYIHRI